MQRNIEYLKQSGMHQGQKRILGDKLYLVSEKFMDQIKLDIIKNMFKETHDKKKIARMWGFRLSTINRLIKNEKIKTKNTSKFISDR